MVSDPPYQFILDVALLPIKTRRKSDRRIKNNLLENETNKWQHHIFSRLPL